MCKVSVHLSDEENIKKRIKNKQTWCAKASNVTSAVAEKV